MIVVKHEEGWRQELPAAAPAAAAKSSPLILAHLSDPHFFSPTGSRFSDFLNKRLYGYLSWNRQRRYEHSDKVVTALIEDLQCRRPDQITVTGDLTHLGLPDEYRRAAEFLRLLGPPERVTVIPGNHDAYVASAWENGRNLWKPYLVGDHGQTSGEKPEISYPFIREQKDTVFIGLTSARPGLPFLATGTLGKTQLQRLEELLEEYGSRRQCRVILIHHPPLPKATGRRKRLTDANAFHALLRRCGAELVLHGHTHHSSTAFVETASGRVPVVGVASASAIGRTPWRRSTYNLYRIARREQKWQIKIKQCRYSVTENRFLAQDEWQPFPQGDFVLPGKDKHTV